MVSPPFLIFKSEEWQDRDVYFGVTEKATYATKLITKVVVDVPTEYDDKGRVVSSWPQKEMKGNISQKGLKYVKHKSGQKNDVLYIATDDMRESYGDEIENGLVVFRDLSTERITGVTVFDFLKKYQKNEIDSIKLPIDIDFKRDVYPKIFV